MIQTWALSFLNRAIKCALFKCFQIWNVRVLQNPPIRTIHLLDRTIWLDVFRVQIPNSYSKVSWPQGQTCWYRFWLLLNISCQIRNTRNYMFFFLNRSDVLGQILPIIGRDWSQSGVAQLYTSINTNGYKFLYLSARAIGQSKITKDLLKSIKQEVHVLPEGPLLLSPTSLVSAFHR